LFFYIAEDGMIYKSVVMVFILLLIAASGAGLNRAAAQQPPANLLTNGSLETPYYGQGAQTRTVPQGWNLWVGAGEPNALPHNDPLQVLDGAVAWSIKQSGTVFTAAGYQQVAVEAGATLRASAWGRVYTCNDAITTCAISDAPYHRSDPSAGATLRVGIDPAGGTDPLAASVQWSAAIAPYDQWFEMSVTAAAQDSAVTVFLYMTQTQGLVLNEAYWDKASLIVVTGAETGTDTGDGEVPYVIPQGVRPDGSIVHVVQSGDTLWSITYAYLDYGVTVDSIAALNDLKPNTRYLQQGQELLVLPPGSVDPLTGQMITPGASTTPTAAASPEGTPTPDATRETQPLPMGTPLASATATVAPSPTTTPTETPRPTETATPRPTRTPRPTATPTDTPAPTSQAVAALSATEGTLCVTVYEDHNVSGTRDTGEEPLPAAEITLVGTDSEETYAYEGANDPLCLVVLAGQYQVMAVPPEGYGMTTAEAVVVALIGGRKVDLVFGGAAGYTPPPAPAVTENAPADTIPSGAVAPVVEQVRPADQNDDNTLLDRLYERSGILVLGLAGLIAVGGVFLLVVLRRPRL
jgi:LysM repeat protein